MPSILRFRSVSRIRIAGLVRASGPASAVSARATVIGRLGARSSIPWKLDGAWHCLITMILVSCFRRTARRGPGASGGAKGCRLCRTGTRGARRGTSGAAGLRVDDLQFIILLRPSSYCPRPCGVLMPPPCSTASLFSITLWSLGVDAPTVSTHDEPQTEPHWSACTLWSSKP